MRTSIHPFGRINNFSQCSAAHRPQVNIRDMQNVYLHFVDMCLYTDTVRQTPGIGQDMEKRSWLLQKRHWKNKNVKKFIQARQEK